MSTVLIILVSLAAVVAALELRRRIRKKSGRLGHSRASAGVGVLNLDRPSRQRRNNSTIPSSLASPVLLGLVIVLLIGWLVVAYLLPSTNSALPVANATTETPERVLTQTLAGRLTPEDARTANPTPPRDRPSKPVTTFVAVAARAMTTAESSLNQVGLLPSRSQSKTVPLPPPRRPVPVPPPTTEKQPRTQATAQTRTQTQVEDTLKTTPMRPAIPRPPTRSATPSASGQSTVVTAAASPGGIPATSEVQNEGTILSSQQEFTVHLGSFAEKGNADKYRTKLAGAGEIAFVAITEVEGRQWYRVMSGRFNTRANAEAHGRSLKGRDLTVDSGRYLIKTID